MAATAAAGRLTEAHRLAQARLAAVTVRQMLAAWSLLDPENLDITFDRWLRVVRPLIRTQRDASTRLAADYLRTFKLLEIGSDVQVMLAAPLVEEQLATSLLVTGPVSIKQAMKRAVPLSRAVDVAQTKTAGAAVRHTLSGGRETISRTVANDRQALGWARVTSARPCAFCAMLASRGPVYKTRDTAEFQPHDACACSIEPVYRADAVWPPGARRYEQLWQEAKRTPGDTAANFRSLVEGTVSEA